MISSKNNNNSNSNRGRGLEKKRFSRIAFAMENIIYEFKTPKCWFI